MNKKLTSILLIVGVSLFCGCAAYESVKTTASKVGTALTDFAFNPSADTNAPPEVSPEMETAVRVGTSFLGPIGVPIGTALLGALAVIAYMRRPKSPPSAPPK